MSGDLGEQAAAALILAGELGCRVTVDGPLTREQATALAGAIREGLAADGGPQWTVTELRVSGPDAGISRITITPRGPWPL